MGIRPASRVLLLLLFPVILPQSAKAAPGNKLVVIHSSCKASVEDVEAISDSLKSEDIPNDLCNGKDIGTIVPHLKDYALAYFAVNFNQNSILNLSEHRDEIMEWVRGGGTLLFTCVIRSDEADAVSQLGPAFMVTRGMGSQPFDIRCSVNPTEDPFMNSIKEWSKNWAVLGSDFAREYTVFATNPEDGRPVLLFQNIGAGRIIVTSSFGRQTRQIAEELAPKASPKHTIELTGEIK